VQTRSLLSSRRWRTAALLAFLLLLFAIVYTLTLLLPALNSGAAV